MVASMKSAWLLRRPLLGGLRSFLALQSETVAWQCAHPTETLAPVCESTACEEDEARCSEATEGHTDQELVADVCPGEMLGDCALDKDGSCRHIGHRIGRVGNIVNLWDRLHLGRLHDDWKVVQLDLVLPVFLGIPRHARDATSHRNTSQWP